MTLARGRNWCSILFYREVSPSSPPPEDNPCNAELYHVSTARRRFNRDKLDSPPQDQQHPPGFSGPGSLLHLLVRSAKFTLQEVPCCYIIVA
jgi:hypothetical protein